MVFSMIFFLIDCNKRSTFRRISCHCHISTVCSSWASQTPRIQPVVVCAISMQEGFPGNFRDSKAYTCRGGLQTVLIKTLISRFYSKLCCMVPSIIFRVLSKNFSFQGHRLLADANSFIFSGPATVCRLKC